MKELTNFQVVQIKRVHLNLRPMYRRLESLRAKQDKIQEEINTILEDLELWEAPIKNMTGGLTSHDYVQILETGELPDRVDMGTTQPATMEGSGDRDNE